MPSKPYEKDGVTKYAYIVLFPDKARAEAFQQATLAALDAFWQ
jgi:hypothetical protein